MAISIEEYRELLKKTPAKKKLNHPESELQQACVTWFDYSYPKLSTMLFAIPNGGARNKVEAKIMKGEGIRPGVADMFLSVVKYLKAARPNTYSNVIVFGLYIEFKIGNNKQSDAQLQFQQLVEQQGYRYIVVRTLEEFIQAIKEYLK